MKTKALFSASLLLAIVGCKPRHNNETSELNQARTGNSIIKENAHRFAKSHFRMFDHHNRTYFKLKELINNKTFIDRGPWSIVHYDYHSDMYRNNSHLLKNSPESRINIGNYINTMIARGLVDKVLWVLPDSTRDTSPVPRIDGCKTIQSQNEIYWQRLSKYEDLQFRDGPADQLICVDSKRGFSFKSATDFCREGERTVYFFKRTMSDLEAQKIPTLSKRTILDLDLDYFDNSGNYSNEDPSHPGSLYGESPQCYSMHHTQAQLATEFRRFAESIEILNLIPEYIAVARSPRYTIVDRSGPIYQFGESIGNYAATKEVIPLGRDERRPEYDAGEND